MSDRLTSSDSTSISRWTVIALPSTLLMIVLYESWEPATYIMKGLNLGLWALFALQMAIVVRGMLPEKAPAVNLALAGCLGALVTSWIFSPHISSPDLAWLLALMGWNFFYVHHETSMPPRVLSGLCAGLAFTLTEETLILALPLLVWNVVKNLSKDREVRLAGLHWEIGLFLGLFALLVGRFTPPSIVPDPDRLKAYINTSNMTLGEIPLLIWPFCLLGLVVSVLQARKVFLALLLPFFVLLPVAIWAFRSTSLSPVWLIAVSIWTAYGLYRMVKGIEQAVRNTAPKEAGKVMGGAIFAVLLAYAVWAGLNIYLYL